MVVRRLGNAEASYPVQQGHANVHLQLPTGSHQTVRACKNRTPRPNPQSQSFSRSYGSILPTSLIYIVLSTRGCSPWRPAAVMSTIWRKNYFFRRIFKEGQGRTGPNRSVGPFRPLNPISGQTDSRVARSLRRKENSAWGSRRRLHVQLRCRAKPTSRCRNIDRLPFR